MINNSNISNVNSNNNKNIMIDRSKNIKIIKKIEQPKRLSEDEIKNLKKLTQRPYLKYNLGERINCYGYIVGRYKNTNLITIINLVDDKGRYITDHVQLNLKSYSYNNESSFIKFKGVVKEYTRKSNNTLDYEIDLLEEPIFLSNKYYNMNMIANQNHYDSKEINVNKIFDYISTIEIEKVYELIDNIKRRINDLTSYDFCNNFIYSFVINQYMLNTATYELYNENIGNIKISEDGVLDILIILSSILYILSIVDYVSIDFILTFISCICDILQGTEFKNTDNEKFKLFCQNKINIKTKKSMNKLWKVIYLRKSNFGNDNNPNNFNFEEIINMAYLVLDDYIK